MVETFLREILILSSVKTRTPFLSFSPCQRPAEILGSERLGSHGRRNIVQEKHPLDRPGVRSTEGPTTPRDIQPYAECPHTGRICRLRKAALAVSVVMGQASQRFFSPRQGALRSTGPRTTTAFLSVEQTTTIQLLCKNTLQPRSFSIVR